MTGWNRRIIGAVTLVCAILLIAIAVGFLSVAGSRSAAVAAAADLQDSQRLASRIRTLRAGPSSMAGAAGPEHDLRSRIAAAARSAGVRPAGVGSIEEQPARRVGQGAYQARPTRVLLREVSLKEVITFLYALTDSTPLALDDFRLSAPSEADAGLQWNVQATLSTLVYSPGTAADGRTAGDNR